MHVRILLAAHAKRPGVLAVTGHGNLRIQLFGPVRAWRAGSEITAGSACRRAVLAVLAAHAGRAVSSDDLIHHVWGAEPPASAAANLYTYISGLRRELEPDRAGRPPAGILIREAGGYLLRIDEAEVDLLAFEALLRQARAAQVWGDGRAELAALTAALALWTDEPMVDTPGPFATAERHRLTEMRLAAAGRQALLQAGPADAAIPPREIIPVPDMPGEDGPFVGRVAELGRLRDAVTAVAAGCGGSLWISGEPGIGKSSLLTEGLRDAEKLGCRVGWGIGDELAQRIPLGVLLECLDPDGAEDAAEAAHQVMDSVTALVRARCAETPMLLVIDDVHWADELSLRAWQRLLPLTRELPLLLVAACRPASPDGRLAELRAAAGASVQLPPLARPEARELVDALGLDHRLTAGVLTMAAGNPYYLRHLVAAAKRGDLATRGGRQLTGRPATLISAVGAHLDQLTAETRVMLHAVALLGGNCTVTELAAAAGRGPADLARSIEEAVIAGLLTESGRHLAFRHPVVRLALYDGMPAGVRIMMHREFAEKIAETTGDAQRVLDQLLAGPVPMDNWTGQWLADNAELLADQAPENTIAVLRRAGAERSIDRQQRERVAAIRARWQAGVRPDIAAAARRPL
jgi:hypothetical protein